MAFKGALERIDTAAGVAVDRHRAQSLTQGLLQRWRQTEGVLHRVELDHAGRVLDGVGVHALHVAADVLHRIGAHGVPRIGGTAGRRSSAARAWACRPSP